MTMIDASSAGGMIRTDAPAGRWPDSRRRVSFGLLLPTIVPSQVEASDRLGFRNARDVARLAEQMGFDAIWLPDHLVMHLAANGASPWGAWEGWTFLAGLAASTERITLGNLVACTGFHAPGVIAKMAESLDEISGGRFVLGLGAGWHEPEYDMFGFAYDHRVGRFEEAMRIIAPLLRGGRANLDGTYYRVRDAVNIPRGPREGEGGPPILVGGNGPRMMRLAAIYADAWNSDWQQDPATVARLLSALDDACSEVGRDPRTLVRTAGSSFSLPGARWPGRGMITGSTEQMASAVRGFLALDIRHYIFSLDPCTSASLEQLAPVIEALDR